MNPSGEPTIDEPTNSNHEPPACGDFATGVVLAGRHRIVALLGRGGMGEVYRAEDLVLNQTVALKFLPLHWSADSERLNRFRQEVALARRVSHRHVCRVHDIGESGGRTFLSMEFVAGEDLAVLRRKMGRLTEEKALEIGRQLCAALAAVHEQGLLHRDLKPANVLLDERGQVKLTDFGVAALAQEVANPAAGTPLYMAPEQLTAREVTVQSDLYSLGLVLYEIFTGRMAFPPDVPLRTRLDSLPPSPSEYAPGLNPAIEQVILQCLAPDPRKRPRSALEVLAVLSGRDLLAAGQEAEVALSPDDIARAGGQGTLSPGVGLACLTLALLGLAGVLWLAPHTMLVGVIELPHSPENLRFLGNEHLKALGHGERPADRAQGFQVDAGARPPTLTYWYRTSPTSLALDGPAFGHLDWPVEPSRPALAPGMLSVRLDPEGRLVQFQALLTGTLPRATTPPDWAEILPRTGLTVARLQKVDNPDDIPIPGVPCDEQYAWQGTDCMGQAVWVEAATCRNRLVWLLVRPANYLAEGPTNDPPGRVWFEMAVALVWMVCLSGIGYWAQDHWRRGVIDRPRAFRFAAFFFCVEGLAWVFRVHHVAGRAEVDLLFVGISRMLFAAAFVWLFYAAVEPHARRVRPETLIAWNRLLSGNWRDPLVGRAVLVGALAAVLLRFLYLLPQAISVWVVGPQFLPDGLAQGSWAFPEATLLSLSSAFGVFLRFGTISVFEGFLALTLLIVLGMCCPRPRWLPGLLYVAIMAALFALAVSHRGLFALFFAAAGLISYQLLTRVGVLAIVICLFVTHLLQFPLTPDTSSWYFPQTCLALGACAGLAVYGYWVSRRPAR